MAGLFKKSKETLRRQKEFRVLGSNMSFADLDSESSMFNSLTGVSTGEMMEVGIKLMREIDRVDQSKPKEVKLAISRTEEAVRSGELKMLDAKTPIFAVLRPGDFESIVAFVLRYRPVAGATLRS